MEKNTLLAIVLCVLVISAGYFVQVIFFPMENSPAQQLEEEAQTLSEKEGDSAEIAAEIVPSSDIAGTEEIFDPDYYREIELETKIFKVTLCTKGGTVKSIKLKEHEDSDSLFLDMICKDKSNMNAFDLYFGDISGKPLDAYFNYKKYEENNDQIVEFWKEIEATAGNNEKIPIEIRKKYLFKPDEYIFELEVQITNKSGKNIRFNNNGYAYSLGFGPQIGPKFEKLDGKTEFRKYMVFNGQKRKNIKLTKPGTKEITEMNTWAAIAGKYFTVIGITDATPYKITFSSLPVEGQKDASRLFFSRPVFKSSNVIDTYKFYVGPKNGKELKKYDSPEKNSFGMTKMQMDRVLDSGAVLGWLQQILKWLLLLFYRLIPNYGFAIILLTVFVKVLMYPLTKKSFESSSRMSALSPKLKELQEKYKGNAQKMNTEIAALYKREGVSPMSGCLPLFLQMPIFFALYGLLNNYFELRGAGFFEPWITDLSQPDSIFNFAPTSLMFIGSDIRLLPILMMLTQILSSKLMQPAGGAEGSQMKMMTYMMPIILLFVLYEAPSGLLLYWTMMNIISIGQQLFINHKAKKRRQAKA